MQKKNLLRKIKFWQNKGNLKTYFMLLKDWLKKNNMKVPAFAKQLGINASGIYKYLYGAKRLSPEMAVRIENFTYGEVSRTEILWPDLYDKDWTYKKDYYGK